MPMIPPPIMALLKIQMTHLKKDIQRELIWCLNTYVQATVNKIKTVENKFENKIEELDRQTKLIMDAYVDKQIKKSRFIQFLEKTNILLAKLIDDLNAVAYDMVIPGYNIVKFKNPCRKADQILKSAPIGFGSARNYFPQGDIEDYKSNKDSRYFENLTNTIKNKFTYGIAYVDDAILSIDVFKGDENNEQEVDAWVNFVTLYASLRYIFIQFKKAVARIIRKLLIFIERAVIYPLSILSRLIGTILKVFEDCIQYFSSMFQSSVSVGFGTSLSVITG